MFDWLKKKKRSGVDGSQDYKTRVREFCTETDSGMILFHEKEIYFGVAGGQLPAGVNTNTVPTHKLLAHAIIFFLQDPEFQAQIVQEFERVFENATGRGVH